MKKNILMIMVAIFLIANSWAGTSFAMTPGEAQSVFIKAGFAYKDGKYDEAAKLYEQIVSGGWESGATYYNLGNSYFKKGQLGYAVLNYERASHLMPRDADLKANARFALSATTPLARLSDRPFWQAVLIKSIENFSDDEVVLAIFLLLIVLSGGHVAALYLSWPRQRVWPVGLLVASLMVFFLTAFVTRKDDEKDLAVVVKTTAARFEPKDTATVHFEVNDGEKVRIEQQEGLWLKVERPDGKVGWIPGGSAVRI